MNKRSPLLSTQENVSYINAIEQEGTKTDYKNVEHLVKENPTAKTFHQMQIERIAMELHQKINRLIWKRMEKQKTRHPRKKKADKNNCSE